MVMTFISFIHSFNFTVIYSFTCQLTHTFTSKHMLRKPCVQAHKKQVNEVEESGPGFTHHCDFTISTSLGLEYDTSGISQESSLPTIAQSVNRILPSLLSRSESSSPWCSGKQQRECRGFTLFDISGKYYACVLNHTWVCTTLCDPLDCSPLGSPVP